MSIIFEHAEPPNILERMIGQIQHSWYNQSTILLLNRILDLVLNVQPQENPYLIVPVLWFLLGRQKALMGGEVRRYFNITDAMLTETQGHALWRTIISEYLIFYYWRY
jgi:hypothetical protein